MGKILLGVIAIFLILGPFSPYFIGGVKTLRTEATTNAFVVTTGAGVTSANVTLTEDLFQANIGDITSISSNATETPIPTTYDEDTKVLLLTVLNDSTVRTLTIAYLSETNDPGMMALGPFFTFLIIGGLIGVIIWGIVDERKGHRR